MRLKMIPAMLGVMLWLHGPWSGEATAAPPALVCLRGRVVDGRTGEPLAGTRVALRAQSLETTTDGAGRFELRGVRPGAAEIELGADGYALVWRRVEVPAGADLAVELRMGGTTSGTPAGGGAGAAPEERPDAEAPSGYRLEGQELRRLSSGLFGDPLRAVQSLPGAGFADDFYAEIAYRGAAPSDVAYYLDGLPVRSPYHAFQQVGQLGSASVFPGDVVASITLLGDGASARYSDGAAAVLAVESREPEGAGPHFRFSADLFQASLTGEGPLDRGHKAAWLVSLRKSYLQYLVSRLGAPGLGLGYEDVSAKVSYRFGPRSRLTVLFLHDATSADGPDRAAELFLETLAAGRQNADRGQAGWTWSPSERAALRSSVAWSRQAEDQRNLSGAPLLRSDRDEMHLRHDAWYGWASGISLEGGGEGTYSTERYARYAAWDAALGAPGGSLAAVADYGAAGWRAGGYVQAAWARGSRLRLSMGGRFDRFGFTGQAVWQPRASAAVALTRRLRWTVSYGGLARFPDFVALLGPFPNPTLRAERTMLAQSGLHLRTGRNSSLAVELFGRNTSHIAYSEQAEWRLSGERTLWPLFGARLRDTLRGSARGYEVVFKRHSAGRLTGSAAYSYGKAHNDDPATGAHFDSDFDQRHALQGHAGYRLSEGVTLSGKLRWSSGVPVAGFFRGDPAADSPVFWLSDQRNQMRAPAYRRLDLRIDKAWYRRGSKVTLYGEIANVTNSRQWRYYAFDRIPFGVSADWLARSRMLPILPAAGVAIEF
ncbi:MAG: TonB-dependent receptor [Paludibaculum sp.]